MSDAALDRGGYFPPTMTDWYRERPFKVAFALSVVTHAALIALIPGFRSVPVETPQVLEVQIVPDEAAPIPRIQENPVAAPKIIQPKIEPAPEPVARQPVPEQKTEPMPEPVVRQPQPAPLPEPELRQVRPEPPPLARVEPRPEPRPTPTVEPRTEPLLAPKTEARRELEPVPSETPPPVVQPRIEPSVVAPTVARPAPAPVTVQPPPVVAPQPQPSAPKTDEANENRLLLSYGQSISKEIKRYQKYPTPAQRRGWEGTAEVLLQVAADGKVTGITLGKSSGHAILDEEALDMVRRASPLPQAPADLRGRALVISVPVVFRLQS